MKTFSVCLVAVALMFGVAGTAAAATNVTANASGSGGQYYTDTGVVLAAGDQVSVSASGTWDVCGGGCPTDANGIPGAGGDWPFLAPEAAAGTLVGSLDSGTTWFSIGKGPTTVTGPGTLLVAANDLRPIYCEHCYSDNSGSQAVTIVYLDADGDGVPNNADPCPNDGDNDADGDGICGNVDVCPADADDDKDGDGRCADVDSCPSDAANDADGDGTCGDVDNCATVANPGQGNADNDSLGDACDPTPNGPRPTVADQCKKDGWKTYGVFKNQGDCVSYVATKGKNAPVRG